MNRDEKKARGRLARPPRRASAGRHAALYPDEPGGGSWIGINQRGIALALINWYAMPGKDRPPVSRGIVVPSLLAEARMRPLGARISRLPLCDLNPFRLIAVSLAERRIAEWRWNGAGLALSGKAWRRHHWFSSGYEEKTVLAARSKAAAEAGRASLAGTLPWLRRLHQSHGPASGAFSICMHRDDAETVSYTEILASPLSAQMRYAAGAPCREKPGPPLALAFTEDFRFRAFA